ncbi:hypothetical protein [uncultured Jannaschia sp.]|uniref:hypothetical protein n=1 Tax=uncultured Jannaschia sp. TaxID=293347 RepID=UPI002620E901|nr:hypothetical protein [uncultured Jannaschia sp.]
MKPSDNPFVELLDQMTTVRRSVEHLNRFSLTKQEAAELNRTLTQALGKMERAVQGAPEALQATLKADRDRMALNAAQAAREAAENVMREIRGQLQAERLHFAQSAGEARRAVWRSFRGFWVWIVAMLATGAFLGLLAADVAETAESLLSVKQMVHYYCGQPWFGGQEGSDENGRTGCAFWYD